MASAVAARAALRGGRADECVTPPTGNVPAPATIRAYLAPKRHWALPLRHDFAQDPAVLLDHGFAHQMADERVAVRFHVVRAGHRKVREALHRVEQLRAGQRLSGGGLGRTLLREIGSALREMLAFLMTGQTYTSTPREPTHEMQAQARAAETKAHSPLLTMQLQLWIHAPTRANAEARFDLLLASFEPTHSAFNHGPSPIALGARQRFDRCFLDQGWWPGASFVVSLAEAHAITGRPLVELETLVGTQVWTRWGGRYGDVPHGRDLRLGHGAATHDPTPRAKSWACIKPHDALKHVLAVGPTGVGKSTFLYWWARSVMEQGSRLARPRSQERPGRGAARRRAPGLRRGHDPAGLRRHRVAGGAQPAGRAGRGRGRTRGFGAVYTMMNELVKGEDLHWGTSMSQAFAYGFRTLAANPQIKPSMLDLERLFFDRDWRQTLLPQVTDPVPAVVLAEPGGPHLDAAVRADVRRSAAAHGDAGAGSAGTQHPGAAALGGELGRGAGRPQVSCWPTWTRRTRRWGRRVRGCWAASW